MAFNNAVTPGTGAADRKTKVHIAVSDLLHEASLLQSNLPALLEKYHALLCFHYAKRDISKKSIQTTAKKQHEAIDIVEKELLNQLKIICQVREEEWTNEEEGIGMCTSKLSKLSNKIDISMENEKLPDTNDIKELKNLVTKANKYLEGVQFFESRNSLVFVKKELAPIDNALMGYLRTSSLEPDKFHLVNPSPDQEIKLSCNIEEIFTFNTEWPYSPNNIQHISTFLCNPKNEATSLKNQLNSNSDGSFMLHLILPTVGRHFLHIMVYNQHVKGSPFALNVVDTLELSPVKHKKSPDNRLIAAEKDDQISNDKVESVLCDDSPQISRHNKVHLVPMKTGKKPAGIEPKVPDKMSPLRNGRKSFSDAVQTLPESPLTKKDPEKTKVNKDQAKPKSKVTSEVLVKTKLFLNAEQSQANEAKFKATLSDISGSGSTKISNEKNLKSKEIDTEGLKKNVDHITTVGNRHKDDIHEKVEVMKERPDDFRLNVNSNNLGAESLSTFEEDTPTMDGNLFRNNFEINFDKDETLVNSDPVSWAKWSDACITEYAITQDMNKTLSPIPEQEEGVNEVSSAQNLEHCKESLGPIAMSSPIYKEADVKLFKSSSGTVLSRTDLVLQPRPRCLVMKDSPRRKGTEFGKFDINSMIAEERRPEISDISPGENIQTKKALNTVDSLTQATSNTADSISNVSDVSTISIVSSGSHDISSTSIKSSSSRKFGPNVALLSKISSIKQQMVIKQLKPELRKPLRRPGVLGLNSKQGMGDSDSKDSTDLQMTDTSSFCDTSSPEGTHVENRASEKRDWSMFVQMEMASETPHKKICLAAKGSDRDVLNRSDVLDDLDKEDDAILKGSTEDASKNCSSDSKTLSIESSRDIPSSSFRRRISFDSKDKGDGKLVGMSKEYDSDQDLDSQPPSLSCSPYSISSSFIRTPTPIKADAPSDSDSRSSSESNQDIKECMARIEQHLDPNQNESLGKNVVVADSEEKKHFHFYDRRAIYNRQDNLMKVSGASKGGNDSNNNSTKNCNDSKQAVEKTQKTSTLQRMVGTLVNQAKAQNERNYSHSGNMPNKFSLALRSGVKPRYDGTGLRSDGNFMRKSPTELNTSGHFEATEIRKIPTDGNANLKKSFDGRSLEDKTTKINNTVEKGKDFVQQNKSSRSVIDYHTSKSNVPGKVLTGKLEMEIGHFGHGSGETLAYPIGITVNKRGDILICDNGNDMVKVFHSDGRHAMTLGSKGGKTFYRPSAIVTNDSCDMFIKDDVQIQVFDTKGNLLRCFGRGLLRLPYGLCINHYGDVITLDINRRNPRLMIFSQEGKLIKEGPYTPLLIETSDVSRSKCRFLSTQGANLIVSDLGRSSIFVTTFNGKFLQEFGSYGQFNEPSGVTVDQNKNILIADSKNDRIQVFSPEYEFMFTINLPSGAAGIKRPSDIHITDDGNLFIVNFLEHNVKKYKLVSEVKP